MGQLEDMQVFIRVVEDLAYRLPRVRQEQFDNKYGPELVNRFFDVVVVQKVAAQLLLDGVLLDVLLVVGDIVDDHDLLAVLATGAAAVQPAPLTGLTEATGKPARTVHRLLEYSPADGRFSRCRDNPLDADLVVVDEASMLDVELAAALFGAIPTGCRVVLVGDADEDRVDELIFDLGKRHIGACVRDHSLSPRRAGRRPAKPARAARRRPERGQVSHSNILAIL